MLQAIEQSGLSVHREPLLDGDAGTAQTVARIRALVDAGISDPYINRLAGTILRAARVPAYDELGEIRALFNWPLKNIRFTKDPDGKETLRPARTIVEWGFGDCDDINAILLPALLGTVGYHTRLITIASHPGAPRVFSHIYCEVWHAGRWIPLDAARRGTRFAVEPARQYRKRAWSLSDDSYEDLKGLGDCGCGCGVPRLGSQMRLGRQYSSRGLGSQMRLGRQYSSRGLGDFDWSTFADATSAISNAAANVVRASTGQPQQLVLPSAGPYPVPGAYAPGAPGVYSAAGSVSLTPGAIALAAGGALLFGLLIFRR